MTDLTAQLAFVAQLRADYERLASEYSEAHAAWRADHQVLCDSREGCTIALTAAEDRLREMTLAAYAETGDKHPAPGVGIQERVTFKYSDALALEWATEHGIALTPPVLDRTAFDKLLRSGALTLPWAAIVRQPVATLAKDLSAYLPTAAAEAPESR